MYPTSHLVLEMEGAPPPCVMDSLFTPAVSDIIELVNEWEDIVSSAFLWGRSKQKKPLQAA